MRRDDSYKNRRHRRGFTMVEVLMAIVITGLMMTATMVALSSSFVSYKQTSESASTHMGARIIMQRMTAMIRTGEDFGPYPVNPILTPTITSNTIEFISGRGGPGTNKHYVTTLRSTAVGARFNLEYFVTTFTAGVQTAQTTPVVLLENLANLTFEMQYDVGPRLRRVTIDMIVFPDDLQGAAVAAGLESPHIRMVASASPRRVSD